MSTATLTSKCQLTLPKAIRDLVGVGPGDTVVFGADQDGHVQVSPQTIELQSLRGSIAPRVQGITLQDMDAVVAQGASRRAHPAASTSA